MANPLRRQIRSGERVVIQQKVMPDLPREQRTFIAISGPGLSPTAEGHGMQGRWADIPGARGTLMQSFWICPDETEQLQAEEAGEADAEHVQQREREAHAEAYRETVEELGVEPAAERPETELVRQLRLSLEQIRTRRPEVTRG